MPRLGIGLEQAQRFVVIDAAVGLQGLVIGFLALRGGDRVECQHGSWGGQAGGECGEQQERFHGFPFISVE